MELAGRQEKLESFIDLARQFGIMELARTGRIALNRGIGGLQTSYVEEGEMEQAAK